MQRYLLGNWMRAMTLAFMSLVAAHAFAADPAGSVSFVIGEASVIGADGKTVPVTRGSAVQAGQTLVTGASGHVHVRMVDGAFISVRPQSRLRIESYHYDAAVPANNRIKFVLEQGVARSITGRAGEASKENYRLNTPLAAIGIRGTDFVVQASNDVTRVTVQSGAIVMAPLGGDCLAGALGPCKSPVSRVLTAAMRNAYLELRNRNEAPLLVPAEKALESPNLLAPPRPEEPAANDKHAKAGNAADSRDAVREAAAGVIKNQVDTAATTVPTPPTSPVTPPVTPPTVVTPVPEPEVPAKFFWGRWSKFIQPGEESKDVVAVSAVPGRERVGWSEVFALYRVGGEASDLPNTGLVKFKLAESEAVVVKDLQTLTAAQITDPSLSIDFAARRFDTSLTVNSAGMSPVLVQASGNVNFQGRFISDANANGTNVNGALSSDLGQAGYVFQRDLSGGLSVIGATRWIR